MSGGHWNYFGDRIRHLAENEPGFVDRLLALLVQIEHELDWGYSGDTCPDCAERRIAPSIVAFLNRESGECEDGVDDPIAILKDRDANPCDDCRNRDYERGKKMSALLDEGLGWPEIARRVGWSLPYARDFYETTWLKWRNEKH